MAISDTEIIKFDNISCNKCDELPIIGTRWKCGVCDGYDLCTACYVSEKHSREHSFLCFDGPGRKGIKVAAMQGSGSEQGRDPFAGINPADDMERGMTFTNISCNACRQREIMGTRWKCAVCFDYDLCINCYRGGKHYLDHPFLCIKDPGGTAINVPPRRAEWKSEVVRFLGINCDVCGQRGIVGKRWKCALCVDYDLCTACYRKNEHDLDHTFLRVDVPGATAIRVAPRSRSGRPPIEAPVNGDTTFPGIHCDSCGKSGIVGPRWKCTVCIDYDLCTACYMAKKHNFDHVFLRFDSGDSSGGALKVSPRAEDRGTAEKVLFRGIYCDSCEERDIAGARWKCDSCSNYDLCTTCYMGGVHDLDHGFLRFDAPDRRGNKVLPRKTSALFAEVLEDPKTSKGEQRAVQFNGIICDGCDQSDITGTRWKCAVCFDYDLCSACYRGYEHDLHHAFLRFDEPDAGGLHIPPRAASGSTHTRVTSIEEGSDEDHGSREELARKLRELEISVRCDVCLDERRNVAFQCGHSACGGCADNLENCHICREPITNKTTLY